MERVNWSVNNFRSLLMIDVAELSTTNRIPYVSHEKGLSLGRTDVAKVLHSKLAYNYVASYGV